MCIQSETCSQTHQAIAKHIFSCYYHVISLYSIQNLPTNYERILACSRNSGLPMSDKVELTVLFLVSSERYVH